MTVFFLRDRSCHTMLTEEISEQAWSVRQPAILPWPGTRLYWEKLVPARAVLAY